MLVQFEQPLCEHRGRAERVINTRNVLSSSFLLHRFSAFFLPFLFSSCLSLLLSFPSFFLFLCSSSWLYCIYNFLHFFMFLSSPLSNSLYPCPLLSICLIIFPSLPFFTSVSQSISLFLHLLHTNSFLNYHTLKEKHTSRGFTSET